jgi:predicted PurR-regulated permease PerM
VTGGLLGAVSIFVITFYYLMEKDFTRSLLLMQFKPSTATRIRRALDSVDQQLGRWMRGQLTLCLIIGIASTVAYGALDVRFWPVLGLIAGITEAIPIIGPWIGGVPAVAMALTQSWQKALMVAGIAVIIQFTENWVLVPRVMKGAVGLTPLTVFLALLVGTEFMGIIGALLAIPIAAAIQVIVSEYIRARREAENMPASSNWRWLGDRHFLGRTTRPPSESASVTSQYIWTQPGSAATEGTTSETLPVNPIDPRQ